MKIRNVYIFSIYHACGFSNVINSNNKQKKYHTFSLSIASVFFSFLFFFSFLSPFNTRTYARMITNETKKNRYARNQEHNKLCVLSRTIRRYHIHNSNTTSNVILFFQFNRTVRFNFIDGPARLHITTG